MIRPRAVDWPALAGALIARAPTPLAVLATDGTVCAASTTLLALLGCSLGELVGTAWPAPRLGASRLTVTACDGRTVAFHARVAVAGDALLVEVTAWDVGA